jgi:enoyl-CoA hydratase/carnithine racemase
MDLTLISVTERDPITTIHLDKLEKGLITMKAVSELTHVLHYLEDESECKYVLFRGSRNCFGRGLDIDHFYPARIDYDGFRKWEEMLRAIEKLEKITVSVAEGECFGAAIDLVLNCDVRLAAEEATFSHDEVRRGILPGQTIFQLSKFCGIGKTMELIQTGRKYTAREAVEMGILNAAFPAVKMDDAVAATLEKYASVNMNILTLSRRLAKESFHIGYEDFIGGYLAAQHRVISKGSAASPDEDDSEII